MRLLSTEWAAVPMGDRGARGAGRGPARRPSPRLLAVRGRGQGRHLHLLLALLTRVILSVAVTVRARVHVDAAGFGLINEPGFCVEVELHSGTRHAVSSVASRPGRCECEGVWVLCL